MIGMGNSVLGLDLMLSKLLLGQIFYAGERKMASGALQKKTQNGEWGKEMAGF